jgi:hypothetical protein
VASPAATPAAAPPASVARTAAVIPRIQMTGPVIHCQRLFRIGGEDIEVCCRLTPRSNGLKTSPSRGRLRLDRMLGR